MACGHVPMTTPETESSFSPTASSLLAALATRLDVVGTVTPVETSLIVARPVAFVSHSLVSFDEGGGAGGTVVAEPPGRPGFGGAVLAAIGACARDVGGVVRLIVVMGSTTVAVAAMVVAVVVGLGSANMDADVRELELGLEIGLELGLGLGAVLVAVVQV